MFISNAKYRKRCVLYVHFYLFINFVRQNALIFINMKSSIQQFVIAIIFSIQFAYGIDTKFYSVNTLSGMSNNETRTVTEDENGFIWAASKTGVLRITNGDYRFYKLPAEEKNILYIDIAGAKNALFAYTANSQLFRYNPILDRFEMLLNIRKMLNRDFFMISQIAVKSENEIWIASSSGLYLYKDNKLTLVAEEDVRVLRLALVGDKVYFATAEKIAYVNIQNRRTTVIYENSAKQSLKVSKFYAENDRLWVGTFASGLFYVKLNDNSFHKLINPNIPQLPILAIKRNFDGSFFLGIDGQGVWKFNSAVERLITVYKENLDNPYAINGDGVYDIFVDSKNRVWVSTFSGGLSYFEQKKSNIQHIVYNVNNKNSIGNNNINHILEARNGDIWFATNNGVSRWKRNTNTWNRYFQDNILGAKAFLAVEEDADGNIWAGTYSSGVYLIDGASGRLLKHFVSNNETGGFASKNVFSIFRDSKDNLWIGGNQGDLYCFLRHQKTFKLFKTTFDTQKIVELTPNTLLIASTVGLIKFDVDSGDYEIIIDKNIVNDVLVHDNKYWLGTRGGGLLCYHPTDKSIEAFNVELGFPSDFVNSLVSVDGLIWFGTENGIGKFDPISKNVIPYNEDFWLSRLSFSANAVQMLRGGKLAWGTNDGVVLFDPQSMTEPIVHAKLFFQDILIAGQSIRDIKSTHMQSPVDHITSLNLKYYQNTLSLELLPIAEKIDGLRLSWRLVGIDNQWTKPTNRFFINYANLAPGRYKLEIRLFDNSLTQIVDQRFIELDVAPPFWRATWFRLLFIVFVLAVSYYYFRNYSNKLRQKHTEEKIRFFSNMAHDIRTSLTLIKAPIDNVSSDAKLSNKSKYYLNVATEQINRMAFVVTQLLDLQKVDIGKGQVFLINVDIVDLLRRRIAMFELLAKNKNIIIRHQINCETYHTAVDELKIEKVIDNLLSNAIKFSEQNEQIEVFLVCNNDKWMLSVRDHGIGISKRDQKKLFKEFYRGENPINSRIVGSGIGLLLVKSYVDMHGGTVVLESEEGVGSVFTVTIPFNIVEVEVEESISAPVEDVTWLDAADNEMYEEKSELVKAKKPLLLIVEDNVDLQKFLKYSFEDDFTVLLSNNGMEAWLSIQKQTPDVIISDVMMPQMDGFELCRHLKSTFETSHIPIIMLTAIDDNAQQMEALGLGADDYVTKPFDISLLTQKIQMLVKNRAVIRDRVLRMFNKPDEEVQLLRNEQNDVFLKRAIEVVRQNLDNAKFGKDDFAENMHVSKSLLYKKIKTLTGQSPVDFIKLIRLNCAYEMLLAHKYTVTEVSEMCGFSSVSYFSTVFKKHFSKSPTEL